MWRFACVTARRQTRHAEHAASCSSILLLLLPARTPSAPLWLGCKVDEPGLVGDGLGFQRQQHTHAEGALCDWFVVEVRQAAAPGKGEKRCTCSSSGHCPMRPRGVSCGFVVGVTSRFASSSCAQLSWCSTHSRILCCFTVGLPVTAHCMRHTLLLFLPGCSTSATLANTTTTPTHVSQLVCSGVALDPGSVFAGDHRGTNCWSARTPDRLGER